ncbi:hypothetical protein ABC383_22550 [Noviherbaspirillum sp. 1P10PC]|uniref:hypothetical protein n=1 Tax=Noviherbaspirillum sp. 1P10PC TaxID=3132292 RepID=UPI00399FDA39
MKYLFPVIYLPFLCACTTPDISRFRADELSGERGGKTSLVFWLSTASTLPDRLAQFVKLDPKFKASVEKACSKPSTTELAPAVVPIVSTLGKLVFDLQMQNQIKKIEALKRASEASYSAHVVLSSDALAKNSCVALIRSLDKGFPSGSVVILKLTDAGDNIENNDNAAAAAGNASQNTVPPRRVAFNFEPVYVRVWHAAAVTRETSSPAIGMSIAISIKSIGKQQNGLPVAASVGEAVVSIPKVQISSNVLGSICENATCPRSEPIPLLAPQSLAILSVAVSEKGDLGFEPEEAVNELKAIQEAMGPAISSAIQEKFKEK